MEITIVADCGKPVMPLDRYISSIVHDRFDAVRETDDLRSIHAISLRCIDKSVMQNIAGKYCAIVACDLTLLARTPGGSHQPKAETSAWDPIPVRYLITMETSDVVEEKAETIFKGLLHQFGSSCARMK